MRLLTCVCMHRNIGLKPGYSWSLNIVLHIFGLIFLSVAVFRERDIPWFVSLFPLMINEAPQAFTYMLFSIYVAVVF